MKLIHDDGYSVDEREAFKQVIYSNTIQSMRVILEAMDDMDVNFAHPDNQQYANIVLEMPIQMDALPPNVAHAIRELWKDPQLQRVYERSREYQLNDSAK